MAPTNTISLHRTEKLVFLNEGLGSNLLLFTDSSGLCSLLHKVQIPLQELLPNFPTNRSNV